MADSNSVRDTMRVAARRGGAYGSEWASKRFRFSVFSWIKCSYIIVTLRQQTHGSLSLRMPVEQKKKTRRLIVDCGEFFFCHREKRDD